MPLQKKILDVGNCGPDHHRFSQFVREHFGATVTPVDDLEQALTALENDSFDLIVVNRLLDRDGSEGLVVIESLKSNADYASIPTMMVTNFPEHQTTAQAAGAVPGFGKATLNTPETLEQLRIYLDA